MQIINEAPIREYSDLISQIKPRIAAVDLMLDGRKQLLPFRQAVESAALQLRMSMEVVAFASLIANKDAYARERAAFAKDRDAGDLIRRLQRLNPNFYPRPVEPVRLPDGGMEIPDLKADFLKVTDFARTHETLAGWCHAPNPYAPPPDYPAARTRLLKIRDRLILLLNCHQVRLIDESEFWLVEMQTQHSEGIRVSCLVRTGPTP